MILHEKKQVVIICLIGLMLAGFLCFRYVPLRKKLKQIETSRDEKQMLITKASIESQRFMQLQEELKYLSEKVEHYDHMIPNNRDLGGFLQKVTALMDEHQLVAQRVQPGTEVKFNNLLCIPVNMQCKGRIKQIFEFFRSLQQLDRVIRVEHVELVNDKELNGEVTMSTQASVFYEAQIPQES